MTQGRIAELEARVRQLADDYEASERRAAELRRERDFARECAWQMQGVADDRAMELARLRQLVRDHEAWQRDALAAVEAHRVGDETALECIERTVRERDEALLRGARLGLEAAAEACDWLPQHSSAETARHCREMVRALDPAAIVAAAQSAEPAQTDALAALAGTWPGDESDEELAEQLRAFEAPPREPRVGDLVRVARCCQREHLGGHEGRVGTLARIGSSGHDEPYLVEGVDWASWVAAVELVEPAQEGER